MRKLIAINSALVILLLSIFVLGYYSLSYPDDFNVLRYIREADWKPFALSLISAVILATALSFLPIKKYDQQRRGAMFLVALQGLLLSFFVYSTVDTYELNKHEFDRLMFEYRQKAEKDMKTGFIQIDYAGGLELPDQQQLKMRPEIDRVRESYGLSYRNSGCVVSAAIIEAQKEYARLTKPYLDKRNGPLWEKKMEAEIDLIRKKYR